MSANIGWLFYKDYFQDINYNNLKDKNNEKIIQKKISNIINQTPIIQDDNNPLGNTHIKATTSYPGLILGSGNAHELPSIEGQSILGFHFDYTSGLPVIQGSSIKGVLRSAFKHQEYIKELLNNNEINPEQLEKEIFDNNDIFFDAVIIKADPNNKILGDDYLAPHGDNPLKNPIPLRFIKVLPNVTFRFDFELSDGIITKSKKTKLFEDILSDLGLGAKTNVGYGKFENFSPFKTAQEQEGEKLALQQKKEADEKQRLDELEKLKKEKEQKAISGIEQLKSCKDIKQAMKILNDSLGKKPKPTSEQKQIIENFWNKNSKKASKSEIKFFKKYI